MLLDSFGYGKSQQKVGGERINHAMGNFGGLVLSNQGGFKGLMESERGTAIFKHSQGPGSPRPAPTGTLLLPCLPFGAG